VSLEAGHLRSIIFMFRASNTSLDDDLGQISSWNTRTEIS
jgi:hypothetical protein